MARQVRRDIIRMLAMANSGHTGGSLGMADIFTALYFRVLQHNPHEFWQDHDKDMVFLSNGHIAPVWYSVLARSGYFPLSELNYPAADQLLSPGSSDLRSEASGNQDRFRISWPGTFCCSRCRAWSAY